MNPRWLFGTTRPKRINDESVERLCSLEQIKGLDLQQPSRGSSFSHVCMHAQSMLEWPCSYHAAQFDRPALIVGSSDFTS